MTEDPKDALASIREAREGVTGTLAYPVGWDIAYGAICGGLVASQGLPVPWSMLVLVFALAGLAICVQWWRNRVGGWVRGYSPKRARWVAFALAAVLVGLMGLSINGAIVVLSALRSDPAASALEPGAVQATVTDATRHILSTTFTTIGGFIPLLVSGDGFWLPFAAAMVGGVAGSAVLALVFAPAAFTLMTRLSIKKHKLATRLRAAREKAQGLPALAEQA